MLLCIPYNLRFKAPCVAGIAYCLIIIRFGKSDSFRANRSPHLPSISIPSHSEILNCTSHITMHSVVVHDDQGGAADDSASGIVDDGKIDSS